MPWSEKTSVVTSPKRQRTRFRIRPASSSVDRTRRQKTGRVEAEQMRRHVDLMQVDEDQTDVVGHVVELPEQIARSSWTSRGVEVGPRAPVAVHVSKMLGQPSAFGAVIGSCRVKSNLSRPGTGCGAC